MHTDLLPGTSRVLVEQSFRSALSTAVETRGELPQDLPKAASKQVIWKVLLLDEAADEGYALTIEKLEAVWCPFEPLRSEV